jgi:hypothetical protein
MCTVNYLLEGQESGLEETSHHWVLVARAQINLRYEYNLYTVKKMLKQKIMLL